VAKEKVVKLAEFAETAPFSIFSDVGFCATFASKSIIVIGVSSGNDFSMNA